MTDTGRGAAHTGGLGSRRAPDTASISSTALFSMCCSEQKTCDQIAVRMRMYAAGSFTDAATPSPTRRTSAGEPLDTTWCFSQAGGYDSSLGRTEEPETHSGSGARQTEKASQSKIPTRLSRTGKTTGTLLMYVYICIYTSIYIWTLLMYIYI